MNTLSKSDYDDLQMLENIHKGILDIYKSLYNQEIVGNMDSPTFIELIEDLKRYRKLEKSIYERIFINIDSLNNVLNKIKMDENNPALNIDNYLISLIEKDKDLMLNRMLCLMHKLQTKFYVDAYHNFVENGEISLGKIKGLAYGEQLVDMISFDQVKLMLVYVLQHKDERLAKNLIWLKYAISYSLPMIEDDFISNNFKVSEDVYLTYPLIGKIFPEINLGKVDASILYNINFKHALSLLESMDNFDLMDERIRPIAVMNLANLKSCIALLVHDDERNKLLEFVNESIEKLKKIPYRECIINLLEQVVKDQKKDLERVRIVSF